MQGAPEASRKGDKERTAAFQHLVNSDLGGLLQETKTGYEKAALNSFRKRKKIFDCMPELVMGDDNSKRGFFFLGMAFLMKGLALK